MTKQPLHGKKLVIVNQDVGYLFIDLANAALDHYDEVVLLSGSIIELGSSLDQRVKVRTILRYRRSSALARLWTWVLGFFQILLLLATRFRKHEIILSSNPPLNTLMGLVLRNKMGLFVLDLYPEALEATGMVSSENVLIRIWSRLNATAYRGFSVIWTLTPSMQNAMKRYDVSVTHAPAWASDFSNEIDDDFLRRERLSESWIVLYSGNLGREHELGCLADCAAQLADREGLLFVVAGEGWQRKILEERIEQGGVRNLRLLPKLPGPSFTALLRHSRIGVVTQSPRTADICIPSKTFNLLRMGLPILGIGKPDSDFGILVNESGSGRVFPPENTVGMIEFISSCWESEETMRAFREDAKRTAQGFTHKNASRMIEEFADA